MTPSRCLAATLVATLAFASTRRAHAQSTDTPQAPPPPPVAYAPPPPPVVYAPAPYAYGYGAPPVVYVTPLVPLTLDGVAPGMNYEVVGVKGDDRVYGRCTAPCTLQLPAGTYRVRVGGENIPSKQSPVVLDGATRVFSQAGSKSARDTGLATAIAGTSVAGIGLLIALVASMNASPCSWGDCDPSHQSADEKKREDTAATTAGIALGVAAVGALVGTIGWVSFASNRTKMGVDGGSGPRFTFGAAPTVGGASFGIVGTF